MPYTVPKNQTRVAEIERKAGTRGERSNTEYKHRAATHAANIILSSRRFAQKNTVEKSVKRTGRTITKLYSESSPIFYLDLDPDDTSTCYGAQMKYQNVRTYEKRAFVPRLLGSLAVKPGTLDATSTYSITRFQSGVLEGSGYEPIESPSVIPTSKNDLSTQPSAIAALDAFIQDAEYIATQNKIQVMPHDLLFG